MKPKIITLAKLLKDVYNQEQMEKQIYLYEKVTKIEQNEAFSRQSCDNRKAQTEGNNSLIEGEIHYPNNVCIV